MSDVIDLETGEVKCATDLAPVDPKSDVAVTSYLQQARDWLATAVETTGPEQIALKKAEIATAAEMTKQLNLSKDIREDASEMVRRAEYALGKAIRKGQAEGTVATRGSASAKTAVCSLPSAHDFATNAELFGDQRGGGGNGILALADSATPEEFEAVIAEAKEEGNLSRANLVRKAKGIVPAEHQTRDDRAEMIRDLAGKGWASRQMVDRVGIGEETIRKIARDYGITIPGDRALHKQRRVNSNDIVENLVIGLEGSVMSLSLIDRSDLDSGRASQWATSLTESLRELNRFAKQIKEMANE